MRAGYSRKTAEQQGYENLRKPEIAQAISENPHPRELFGAEDQQRSITP
jgi:phage terminase small subunit